MAIPRFKLEDAALLVIDVQERLLPAIDEHDRVERQVGRLIDGANVLGLPILVTEQYRKGLGVTVPSIAKKLTSAVCNHEKLKFSACIEPVRQQLAELGRHSVIVCGIEAHVCVLQTCLDFAQKGYVVGVAEDAVGSRHEPDRAAALARMRQAGVIPTTVESVLLELVHEAGTERFKAMLPVIK